jgi:hypothetical protein
MLKSHGTRSAYYNEIHSVSIIRVIFLASIAFIFGGFQGHRAKREWEARVLADVDTHQLVRLGILRDEPSLVASNWLEFVRFDRLDRLL